MNLTCVRFFCSCFVEPIWILLFENEGAQDTWEQDTPQGEPQG